MTIVQTVNNAALHALDVSGLTVGYEDRNGWRTAVHGIDFTVAAGEVVALVGESGSGKTTTAQAVIGLLPSNGRLEGGSIRLNGQDIARWPQKRLDGIRGSVVSLIPQDPGSSLNPVKTIGRQVAEILTIHGKASGAQAYKLAIELLHRVGLNQPELRAGQYPHELSGGMKQRVLIAIAVALKPSLIIADEPTSALDVTVQRHILDLIDELRQESGTAVLLVTHDLGVAADRADRLVVLQHGVIQEQGRTAQILRQPKSSYTRQLLADAPSLNIRRGLFAAIAAQQTDDTQPANDLSKDIIVVENLVQEFGQGMGAGFRRGRRHFVPRPARHHPCHRRRIRLRQDHDHPRRRRLPAPDDGQDRHRRARPHLAEGRDAAAVSARTSSSSIKTRSARSIRARRSAGSSRSRC